MGKPLLHSHLLRLDHGAFSFGLFALETTLVYATILY